MIVEVYLTVALVVFLVLGTLGYFLLPPAIRRIKAENRLEARQRREKEHEKCLREAAERELNQCLGDYARTAEEEGIQDNTLR